MRLGAFGLAPVVNRNVGWPSPPRIWRPIVPAQPAPSTPAPAPNTGTPVPAGFATNQIFVNTDGSQWMYSASQGNWINVGTPYNVNAPSSTATTPVSAAPAVTTVAAPNVAGTPVPANFPTNQIYVNSDGSQWVFNAASNSWVNMAAAATTSSAAFSPSTGAPINVSVATPTTGPYDSLIAFATDQSLLPGVPNWLIAVGAVIAVKMAGNMGKRR